MTNKLNKQGKEQSEPPINDTENKILRAAEHEFMSKGFAGARTTSIAEAAGVTHAMLHYYFRTKEKLFDRIISEKVSMLKDLLFQSVVDANDSLEDMIKNIIGHHLDFIAANPDLPRFIVGELSSNSDRAAVILNNIQMYAPLFIDRLQQKIDETAGRGECRRIDAHMLMLDVASLNIFPYIVTPIVNAALGNMMVDSAEFLTMRKQENFDTIMRKLRL
ncbi:MAG: TetR/AcrR family transcriptional regulator [Muribaculaceae bacterium]|nr:TetR/AcrR family transcriptional regulator [Muribaculaceae bacterium]